MKLQGKSYLEQFSYKAQEVEKMEQDGIEIYDIVTAQRSDPCLQTWVQHFRERDWPIFGTKYDGKAGVVKLLCRRTVDSKGHLLPTHGAANLFA